MSLFRRVVFYRILFGTYSCFIKFKMYNNYKSFDLGLYFIFYFKI